jgi:Tfp pilus assembly protein FimV
MPPGRLSRYSLSLAIKDDQGRTFLTDPDPFRYQDLSDNKYHTVIAGDTLWELAARAFPNISESQHLWPIVAWFQPQPIHDPTLALEPGREMVFPSERTVLEKIFNPERGQR